MRRIWVISLITVIISASVFAVVMTREERDSDLSSESCQFLGPDSGPPPDGGNSQQFGLPVATPNVIVVNEPTIVTVAVDVPDSSLIRGNVDLVRVDTSKKHCRVIARMNNGRSDTDSQDGRNKIVNHSSIFTTPVTFNESISQTIELRVVAKFKDTKDETVSLPVFVVAHNPLGFSLGDLSAASPLIVEGTVSSVISTMNKQGTDIITNVSIEGARALKGNLSSSNIVVDVPGGTLGHRSTSSLGMPTFSAGETVLLLLKSPNADGHLTIKDDALGTFHIHANTAGIQIAVIDSAYQQVESIHARAPDYQRFLNNSSQGIVSVNELVIALGLRQ